MVKDDPMRCAEEDVVSAASKTSTVGDAPTVGTSHHATSTIAGARGSIPRDDVHYRARGTSTRADDDPALQVICSGESDASSDSKSKDKASGSPGAAPASARLAGSGKRSSIYVMMFGTDDSSDESSSKSSPSRSHERDQDVRHDDETHRDADGDVVMCHHRSSGRRKGVARGVNASVETTQEVRDREALLRAPQKTPWLPSAQNLERWSEMTSGVNRIPLFDASRLHGLDVGADNFSIEQEFYVDAFFKHRWFKGHHDKDGTPLVQAWNAFISNMSSIGREAWLEKLIAVRNRFEKRSPLGARFKLHRLSREAGWLCLSWGDACPCCVNSKNRAPREAYSLSEPPWRSRITSEMRDGIDTLQSLYASQRRTFFDGPSGPSSGSDHTDVRDPVRQPSVGIEAPRCPKSAGSHATGRGNSSDVTSSRGGSKYESRGNVDHRVHPPVDVAEEGKSSPLEQTDFVRADDFHRVADDLREDYEHERDRRLCLRDAVQTNAHEFTKFRAEYYSALVENERSIHSLRDELRGAHHEIASLRDQTYRLERDRKDLMGILERGGYLHLRKKVRTDSTDGDVQRKTYDAYASYETVRSCMRCLVGATHETGR